MMSSGHDKLTRIGVFYDGGFFTQVSNYYCYVHPRKARLNIEGLHNFIRDEVAKAEGSDVRYCQIVDAHYFRGRLPAQEALNRQVLLQERQWDEVLMRQGVVTHYTPLSMRGGKLAEKGIDVWFALEAFELAIYKRFNVSVLVSCDGDYVPLARKLNTIGTRVMVLGWDFEYMDERGTSRKTITSIELLDEVTYPILMHNVIDDKTRRNDPLINDLFLKPKALTPARPATPSHTPVEPHAGLRPPTTVTTGAPEPAPNRTVSRGKILSLKEGFGFIKPDASGENLFFHRSALLERDFHQLHVSDPVDYVVQQAERGPIAIDIHVLAPLPADDANSA